MTGEVAVDDSGMAQEPGFRAVFDAHFGSMAGLAQLLGADDPEDAAAEGFARLYGAWPDLRDERAALAYLRTTVTRLVSNRRRHLAIADRRSPAAAPSAEPAQPPDDDLTTALASLTVTRRAAIVLRYYADLSHEQIGKAMGCTTVTARSHVHRGLADLRRLWRGENL